MARVVVPWDEKVANVTARQAEWPGSWGRTMYVSHTLDD